MPMASAALLLCIFQQNWADQELDIMLPDKFDFHWSNYIVFNEVVWCVN
jgi:hypothetical protein